VRDPGRASASLTAQAIVPAFFSSPSPVNFGNVLVGTSTQAQTITLTNDGQQTSGMLRTSLSGADPGDFTIDTSTCTGTLAGGASCSVTVHFTPAALGSRTATLTIAANPGDPRAVALSGTGVNTLTVSPASFTFQNQDVGTTSASTDSTLTDFGTLPLTLFGLGLTDPGDFPVTANTCLNGPLQPGGSCTISVAFDAAVLGAHSSTLDATFTDPNDASYSATFTVSGTSIVPPPDLATTMSVASENFSNASVTISVTNLGSANSVPATMTIDVDPTQDFSYEAGAGTDCTAQVVNGFDSEFTCPVPVIAPGATYTRTLTVQNLSGQGPRLVVTSATTNMPGDTNSSNNTGFADVEFS
jgi:Abnormal spindle-like microcephaly-assoc'd, ASPM-SPD-2-Hydin